jgi:translation elongation factor EF-Tu-like GTPase
MGAFRFTVKSIFHVAERGTVFQGEVEEGSVSVGEAVTVSSPAQSVSAEVSGIERTATRKLVSSARSGDDIAILVRDFDIDEIEDGIWRQEHEITPLAIEISRAAPEGRWWQFWKW